MRDRLEKLRWLLHRTAAPAFMGMLALAAGTLTQTGSAAPGLLLVGLGGTWWWLKQRRIGRSESQRLRCVESLTLKPGSSLHLVVVEGKRLLIGCAERQIRLLGRLDGNGGDP
jgi:flagellar biogenesis protein FliO